MIGRLVLLLFCLTSPVFSYNFLVFCPLSGHSHTTFFAKIADTLSEVGHNVTFFTPTIMVQYENLTYVKSTKHVVKMPASEELKSMNDIFENSDMTKFWYKDGSLNEFIPVMKTFKKMQEIQSEWMFKNIELLDELKRNYKYDAIIFESFVFQAYPVMDYLGIKTQIPAVSVTQDVETSKLMGEPFMPSAHLDMMSPFDEKMTLVERMINAIGPQIFYAIVGLPNLLSFSEPREPIQILARTHKSAFLFINSNPYLDFPRPTITKTVQIGGISVNLDKMRKAKVDEETDKILNLRSKTMLISFGSVQQSQFMPYSYKAAIIEALSKFPYVTFIWKYESENHSEFDRNLPNVHFMKWVPQRALLTDSRLTAFFTHGGLGSVNELSYTGKPAIICPIFGDQMRNAKMLVRHGGAIELSKYDLDKPLKLEETIRNILYDSSYEQNAQSLAHRLEKQPIKPAELLVKHCEFAAEFGELSSLDPYSRQMSFFTYFMIDIALIFLFVIFGFIAISYVIVRCLYRKFFSGKTIKTD